VHAATVARAAAPVRGPRVAVISDSGGQGVLAADLLEGRGLELPVLSAPTQQALAAVLPGGAAVTTNPVDLAGSGEADLHCYARAVEAVAASGEVDAVVLSGYFGRYAVDAPSLAPAEEAVAGHLAGVAGRHGVPLLVHAMVDPSDPGPTVSVMRAARVPVFGSIDDLVDGLAPVALAAAQPGTPAAHPAAPEVPGRHDGYAGARALLEACGLVFPPAVTLTAAEVAAGGSDALAAAAARVGTPVALKATGLAHKTESGGVVLALASDDEVAAAAADLRARLGDVELTVEAMAPAGRAVELIVAARRDPAAGVVVSVGAGGVLAELLDDVAVELGPLDHAGAAALLGRTSVSRLLGGWRGAAPLDEAAAADAVVAVGRALAADPGLLEIEVNPLRVADVGALALDAWATADPDAPGRAG
jgi:acyl-CoA synthetase (NDP forming)